MFNRSSLIDPVNVVQGVVERARETSREARRRAPKLAAKRSPKSEATRRASLAQLKSWAERYVAVALVLSAALNAAANVQLCGAATVLGQLAAGVLGAVVPALVWLAGKQAGHAYRAGRSQLAAAVGAAGVCLLALSIYHCAHALAVLTGSGVVLSLLLAIGIDYGLVASEVAAILAHEEV